MNAVTEIIKDAAYYTDRYLADWADWMQEKEAPDGLPRRACGGLLQNYTTLDTDNERAYSEIDERVAVTIDAIIADLPPASRAVIFHAYGLAQHVAVWRYEATLALAKLRVQDGLRRRGIWLPRR